MPSGVYVRTEETKCRMSEVRKGHHHSEETKHKISESCKGKVNSEEARRKLSEALKGVPLSEEHKRKLSEAKKGKPLSEEHKCRMSESQKGNTNRKGKLHSEETRRKMRVVAANRGLPNYNPRACKYFDFINRLTNTEGRHALHGGEFHVKELGYYVDYYNPDLKMIIEWDEPYHYDSDGNLRTRDVRRQREIQELYSDFTFTRVKQLIT